LPVSLPKENPKYILFSGGCANKSKKLLCFFYYYF